MAVCFPGFAAQSSVRIIDIAGAGSLQRHGNIFVFLVKNFPGADGHFHIAAVNIAADDLHFNRLVVLRYTGFYLYGKISVVYKTEVRAAPGNRCIKPQRQIEDLEIMAGTGDDL